MPPELEKIAVAIPSRESVNNDSQAPGKRLFDISFALIALVVFSPVLVIVSCLLRVQHPHQVIFRQMRVGRGGELFEIYKFCTMTGSGQKGCAVEGQFDLGDTSRVTALGKILRKWKLDELPQLINVLRGDMSLVGPRPEIQRWVNAYAEQWQDVLQVRPGMTDPASIMFRNENALLSESADPEALYRTQLLPAKLKMYQDYVNRNSLVSDLKIMCDTVLAVLNIQKNQDSFRG